MTYRLVVFTAALGGHVERTIETVLKRQKDIEILVVLHQPPRRLKTLLRNQMRNVRKHGWRWIPYQFREVLRLSRPTKPHRGGSAGGGVDVRVERVSNINAASTIETVRAFAPDLGLSLAAPILKPGLFDVPVQGTLNIHKGKLPDYRGMPPAFWEIWNGAGEVGITVHKVEAGLDTGPVLIEESIPVEPHSTPTGLRVRLDEIGVRIMADAVALMREGKAAFRPQTPGGRTYTRPTLAQEAALKRRTAPRSGKAIIKSGVFRAYSALRPTDRNRVLVLLYHRVSDALRDSVTIGVEQFDEHMRYLAGNTRIVSLDDITKDRLPADGPIVAVTFADGYLDNYENAAPILIRHGIPATFFVSTGKVDENAPFEHDLRKLGRGLPNMNWDQIREMQAEGLTFGSHTVNHINLAKSEPGLVEKELLASRATLERELGLGEVMFAYPFGKRADITPERLEQVKAAGYVANCSAYGGVNSREIDPWNIRRQGVDHSYDVPAIAAKLAGWKSTHYV
ncbi:polysaccharide deacetylase family protein [Sphingosinicella microcystinivorans]|uniref:polysaccharide deacetylase family protein n=1 Tax=Sphingosinicella microcystinivorans TaxID=335406 RepID=UPI0022F3B3D9|nr:polysaccharide deacetylase family protein [Sphingosinicella microcystinivorans]WBX86004.1 polysaccharide deacetylase family protein [Sphingosinicella microcystinivorans]